MTSCRCRLSRRWVVVGKVTLEPVDATVTSVWSSSDEAVAASDCEMVWCGGGCRDATVTVADSTIFCDSQCDHSRPNCACSLHQVACGSVGRVGGGVRMVAHPVMRVDGSRIVFDAAGPISHRVGV